MRVEIMLLICATAAVAGPTTRQVASMDLAPLQKLVDAGDANAQFELARRMLFGRGVKLDAKAAVALLEKSMSAGNAQATYELSVCYRGGIGVKVDDTRAEGLLNQAAEKGAPAAQVVLAERVIATGPDTPEAEQARQQLLKLSRAGEPAAQLSLARIIAAGNGGRLPKTDANNWLLKSAAGDDDRVALQAVRLVLEGLGPIRADPERAAVMYRKLAERGLRPAYVELAKLAPESFRGLCKQISPARLLSDPGLIGTAVTIQGTVTSVDDSSWRMEITGGEVKVVTGSGALSAVKPGRTVRAFALVEELGSLNALAFDVTEPDYRITYELKMPQVVPGGKTHKVTVSGSLTNTSRQPIRELKLLVALRMDGAVEDERKSLKLEAVKPGETRDFAATFSVDRVDGTGKPIQPRAEVSVESLEW